MIDSMPTTMLLAKQGTVRLAHSARPDAPVVEARPSRRARRGVAPEPFAARGRSAVARGLH
ncbi:hypothetical protein, partial [Actinotalea ferrariae]|uniref:hypothetical protein n=1 Tax=Actinotalea ferrariae TaxID=1386098 RepID=UPI001C8CC9AB